MTDEASFDVPRIMTVCLISVYFFSYFCLATKVTKSQGQNHRPLAQPA